MEGTTKISQCLQFWLIFYLEELPTGEDADGPRFNGYQYLTHLLYSKRELINSAILEVIFKWIGMGQYQERDNSFSFSNLEEKEKEKHRSATEITSKNTSSKSDSSNIPSNGVLANPFVFRFILMELHLWNNSNEMLQSILRHISGLISTDNTHHKYNLYK